MIKIFAVKNVTNAFKTLYRAQEELKEILNKEKISFIYMKVVKNSWAKIFVFSSLPIVLEAELGGYHGEFVPQCVIDEFGRICQERGVELKVDNIW